MTTQILEQSPDLTFEDIGPDKLKGLSDDQLLAVYAAFMRTWDRQSYGDELPLGREQFVKRYQYVMDEFKTRPDLDKPAGDLDTAKESFHLKGPHWIEVPESGTCPVSHPNKDTSPDGKLKCYTNDAHASLLRSRVTEQVALPKNARDMTVAETLAAVKGQGRKFSKVESKFEQQAPDAEKVCGVCRFYLRAPDALVGRCQVVEGAIPWFSTSELFISAEDEAEASFQEAR